MGNLNSIVLAPWFKFLVIVLFGSGCIGVASVERSDFVALILLVSGMFLIYLLVISRRSNMNIYWVLVSGILFRLLFFDHTPQLSDDYFRFLWDGRLTALGENPYETKPENISPEAVIFNYNGEELLDMNSLSYYSVYPPVCQIIWATSDLFSSHQMKWGIHYLRGFVWLMEIGTMFLLVSLLRKNPHSVAIYAWNPLVIIEFSGNLHPEFIMVFFMVLAWYLWNRKWHTASAAAFGLAVSAKLIPLIIIPFLVVRIGWKKTIVFALVSGIIVLITFVPFLTPALVANCGSSLDLYFRNFEFNGSIYYISRSIGEWIYGYNTIHHLGPILSLIAFICILMLAFKKSLHFFVALGWAFTVYLLFSTTVHPWYIATLVVFAAFTRQKVAIVWSLVAFLSYSHYSVDPGREFFPLIALEYTAVFLAMWWDWRHKAELSPACLFAGQLN